MSDRRLSKNAYTSARSHLVVLPIRTGAGAIPSLTHPHHVPLDMPNISVISATLQYLRDIPLLPSIAAINRERASRKSPKSWLIICMYSPPYWSIHNKHNLREKTVKCRANFFLPSLTLAPQGKRAFSSLLPEKSARKKPQAFAWGSFGIVFYIWLSLALSSQSPHHCIISRRVSRCSA